MAASGKGRPAGVDSRHIGHPAKWSPRRLIAVLGGVLVLLAITLFASLAYNRWHDTLAEAEQLATNFADLLSEHAGRVFDASNLVASQAIFLAHGRDWRDVERSESIFRELTRLAERFDYISAVWLVDADGNARASSRDFPLPPVSVADREHFQRQRTEDVGPFVSTLLRSQIADETNIVLSRRIDDERGAFRGAALVVIDPTYFLSFYRAIRIVYPVTIDVFRSDLAVVIHFPEIAADQALAMRKWPDRQRNVALGEAGVIYRAPSGRPDGERLEAYQRVREFPLYVSVGIDRAAIVARWRGETVQQAAFAAAALGAVLLLVGIALWRARREELARQEIETLAESLERRVRERTAEVERSAEGLKTLLGEKDVLLREVHHRVKNNLQIISSLLSLYARRFDNPEVQRGFTDCLNQVRAMGLVHELLFRSANLAEIDFDEYLRVLADQLVTFFGRGQQVRVMVEAAPLRFDLDRTIPLALIVTEAITNAFKHAFPGGRRGTISVRAAKSEDTVRVTVADDGIGLPGGPEKFREGSLGMKLLHVLADQLDGRLEYSGGPGTTVVLTLPLESGGCVATGGETASDREREAGG